MSPFQQPHYTSYRERIAKQIERKRRRRRKHMLSKGARRHTLNNVMQEIVLGKQKLNFMGQNRMQRRNKNERTNSSAIWRKKSCASDQARPYTRKEKRTECSWRFKRQWTAQRESGFKWKENHTRPRKKKPFMIQSTWQNLEGIHINQTHKDCEKDIYGTAGTRLENLTIHQQRQQRP